MRRSSRGSSRPLSSGICIIIIMIIVTIDIVIIICTIINITIIDYCYYLSLLLVLLSCLITIGYYYYHRPVHGPRVDVAVPDRRQRRDRPPHRRGYRAEGLPEGNSEILENVQHRYSYRMPLCVPI